MTALALITFVVKSRHNNLYRRC